MSRQWRSDDTSKWKHGFGRGSVGDVVISSNTTISDIHSSVTTVSSGGFSITVAAVERFPVGSIIVIHQTRGTGAGNWELNIVAANPGGTGSGALTLKYPLQNTYTDSGTSQAQAIRARDYKNLTINSSVTFGCSNWDGNIGGIFPIFVSKTLTINGTLGGNASGYNGGGYMGGDPGTGEGLGGGTMSGYSGESYNSARNAAGGATGGSCGGCVSGDNTAAQYNGGGAGRASRGADGASGGGGGGHGVAGSNGASKTGSPGYGGGVGGAVAGNAGLTSLVLGGGGGGPGGWHDAGAATAANHRGGAGGKVVMVFAKNIVIDPSTGSIACNGANSVGVGDARGGSGAGAGGAVLLKFMTGSLGTNRITVAGGAGSGNSGNTGGGGAGGAGRIHVDYSKTISGSASPAIDTRQDATIKPALKGGSFLYALV